MYLDLIQKFPHFEFLEMQEALINFWFRWQFNLVIFFSLLLSIGYFTTINNIVKYVFQALFIAFVLIMFLCSFIAFKKTYRVWKLYKSSFKVFNLNGNEYIFVKKIFRVGKWCLFIIMILEFLIPIIPITFIFKLIFFRNFHKLQKIVYIDE